MKKKRCKVCKNTYDIEDFSLYEVNFNLKDKGKYSDICDWCRYDINYPLMMGEGERRRFTQLYNLSMFGEVDDGKKITGSYIRTHFKRYEDCAKKRKKEFKLSFEEFKDIVIKPCHYCGSTRTKIRGVDRVDNKVGYVYDNCVPCCVNCNRAKWGSTKEDFINWARKIVYRFEGEFED